MTLKCAQCLSRVADKPGEVPIKGINLDAINDAATVVNGSALCVDHAIATPQGGWVVSI